MHYCRGSRIGDKMKTEFKNTCKARVVPKGAYPGTYIFDEVPPLLMCWSRLFQHTISQAGTFVLTKNFHNQNFGIYKAEGGCNMPGFGELVLHRDYCRWNFRSRGKKTDDETRGMAGLISHIVLNWNPMDPVNTILVQASVYARCKVEDLKKAVETNGVGNPFMGDPLYNFFYGSEFDRDYYKFCLVKFSDLTEEQAEERLVKEGK